jgi:murein L,D-transpeptidase YafK
MKVYLIYFLLFLFPAGVFAETADLLVVEKEARRLTVLKGDTVLARYTISLGSSPEGAKRCDGDRKTPEGEYIISGRNSASAFYKSLRISYPNEGDRAQSRVLKCSPGGDIMIHGLPNGRGWVGRLHRFIDWTKGCVAVTDGEMDEIWKSVQVGCRVRIEP